MTEMPEEMKFTLKILREAVAKTLDRKRRLEHDYVVWQDGKPVMIGEDAPNNPNNESMKKESPTEVEE